MRFRSCLPVAAAVFLATPAAAFEVTSPAFDDGARIPHAHVYRGFGCDGDNVSPALTWSGVPDDTESLAVTVHDPDAPKAGGWWHWLVVNLPPGTTKLPRGAGSGGDGLPEGAVQTRTSFKEPGYGGPCPPEGHGTHHYHVTVHALDSASLDVGPGTRPAEVKARLAEHRLAKGTLTGIYSRP